MAARVWQNLDWLTDRKITLKENPQYINCMKVGHTTYGELDHGMVPIFKKGAWKVCFNYWGITLVSIHRKVYSRVLERRRQLIIKLWIREEQCRFCLVFGTVYQLFTLAGLLGASLAFIHPVYELD